MKNFKKIFFILLILPLMVFSQDKKEKTKKDKPSRPAFESSTVINNPSNVVFKKNTLEVQMSHRFGLINGGKNDMAGFWAPANIRIGLAYSITNNITLGFGTTKFDRLQDFNLKVALLRQTRSDKVPVSVTYYGNYTVNARPKDNFVHITDRYSFFSTLIIAKRFTPKFSLQVAPSISHYNSADHSLIKNDMIAFSVGTRYKISDQTAIILDYSQPLTPYKYNNPKPGFSTGFEFTTSGHVFQLFISNYNGILPQKNYTFNQNDFFKGDFLIGFNITRVYDF